MAAQFWLDRKYAEEERVLLEIQILVEAGGCDTGTGRAFIGCAAGHAYADRRRRCRKECAKGACRTERHGAGTRWAGVARYEEPDATRTRGCVLSQPARPWHDRLMAIPFVAR